MDSYNYLIAKTDKEDKNKWLPLYMHLRDTADVIKRIISTLPDSVIRASGLPEENFRRTAIFLAAVHDIGKATSYFQNIITKNNDEWFENLNSAGYTINRVYSYQGKTPHAYAGQWILESEEAPFEINAAIADIVGAHHGKPFESNYNGENDLLKIYPGNFYGDTRKKRIWIDTWEKIVSDALCYSGYGSIDDIPDVSVEGQIILSGLLIEADWIASNTTYFPLISEESEDDYQSFYPDRVNGGWSLLDFPSSWQSYVYSMDEDDFDERFGFLPNEIQSALIDIVNKCEKPGIFVLEAPMGCGKTEAALAASEILAGREGEGGVFFGLPTQATSNGIFNRLLEWAEAVSEDTVTSIQLAHGAAELNEDYQRLLIKGQSNVDEDETSGVEVHSWFQGNKKSLLADFVIGTVDQFLLATLKRKHFMLRHLGLAGKVVIIDECHAYDTYMMTYLKQSVRWMAAYGIPVILLSATLPYEKRKDLIDAYAKTYVRVQLGLKHPEYNVSDWYSTDRYPLITYTDGSSVDQVKVSLNSENKQICIRKISGDDRVIEAIMDRLSDGGCACVIANTVRAAQQIYDRLCSGLTDYTVMLYHSQFTMPDRAEKEKRLLSHLGKKSTEEARYRFVLVGTQVLEQSLDYDADLMITQMCPMDLFLQRIGRLHRHKRDYRPDKCVKPVCLVWKNDNDEIDDGSKAVYGSYLLMRTEKILSGVVNLPADISPLVQSVYDFSDDLGLTNDEYLKAKEDFFKKQSEADQKSQGYLMPSPLRTLNSIENIISNMNTDKNDENSVRDSDGSIEVIALKDDESGYAGTFDDKYSFDIAGIPDRDQALVIARQKLRLPAFFSKKRIAGKTILSLESDNMTRVPLWQQASMLQGELVMLFDSNSEYFLHLKEGDGEKIYRLYYDTERGLEYQEVISGGNEI